MSAQRREKKTVINFDDVQRLQRLGPRSLDHLPPYARDAAISAILKVKSLEESRLLREGLYYIVLVDLSGSTAASNTLGSDQNKDRIQDFVEATIQTLEFTPLVNSALFIKDVGDAALFIFSAFTDVLEWHALLQERLAEINARYADHKNADLWKLRAKTVVHLGEVTFIDDRDPMALAVNQVFKIEKNFQADEIGCTDHVRNAIGPVLRDRGLITEEVGEQTLPEDRTPTKLWRLVKQTK